MRADIYDRNLFALGGNFIQPLKIVLKIFFGKRDGPIVPQNEFFQFGLTVADNKGKTFFRDRKDLPLFFIRLLIIKYAYLFAPGKFLQDQSLFGRR